jgi:hypothetical protein
MKLDSHGAAAAGSPPILMTDDPLCLSLPLSSAGSGFPRSRLSPFLPRFSRGIPPRGASGACSRRFPAHHDRNPAGTFLVGERSALPQSVRGRTKGRPGAPTHDGKAGARRASPTKAASG